MDVEVETVPILCMCRLCLNYSQDCSDIVTHSNSSNSIIRHQIRKYLCLEINHNDSLPTTVCQQCIDQIQAFDKFFKDVAHHQTQLITTPKNLIQLSPAIVSNANGTVIITLQSTPINVLNTNATNDDNIVISNLEKDQASDLIETEQTIDYEVQNETDAQHFPAKQNEKEEVTLKPAQIITDIKRELDDLNTDDFTAEIHGESDNDDENTTDDQASEQIDDFKQKNFDDFPKKLIEHNKLLYKGQDLLEMISKFYRLECEQCKKKTVFKDLTLLCKHYVDVHQMKGYLVCCDRKLIKLRAIALHMARHLQPDAFKCPVCKKILTCPKILQYHIQNHLPESERPLACSQCPRRFSYSSALVAHAISHQPESQRVVHICDECGKVFASAGRLTTHINVSHMQYSQELACHICGKKFACRSNLSYHLTTHQPKIRQVQCIKCDKWLKNKFCLRKHMVQHSSVRYNCSLCDYSALNQQCFRNHMRVQHTNDKPFRCDECGKAFKLKNTLKNHLVQHTGVHKFVCPFCNRSFASSGNYYSHRKRMHPQELAAMKLKQEEEDRQLREQPSDKKFYRTL